MYIFNYFWWRCNYSHFYLTKKDRAYLKKEMGDFVCELRTKVEVSKVTQWKQSVRDWMRLCAGVGETEYQVDRAMRLPDGRKLNVTAVEFNEFMCELEEEGLVCCEGQYGWLVSLP
jgi:hypothetical protein